jgi:hypothetical protein
MDIVNINEEYKAFYIALPHSNVDDIWLSLNKYTPDNKQIILAKEISKKSHQDISGEHFHVLVQWTEKIYEAYKKTILINKYKLTGKATKDGHRKYGKIKDIKNYEKLVSYTIKQNNYQSLNWEQEELDNHYGKSFIKEDKKAFIEELMEHLLEQRPRFIDPLGEILIKIIKLQSIILDYHINKQDKPLSRPKLEYYTNHYIQCIEPLRKRQDFIEEILIYIIKK